MLRKAGSSCSIARTSARFAAETLTAQQGERAAVAPAGAVDLPAHGAVAGLGMSITAWCAGLGTRAGVQGSPVPRCWRSSCGPGRRSRAVYSASRAWRGVSTHLRLWSLVMSGPASSNSRGLITVWCTLDELCDWPRNTSEKPPLQFPPERGGRQADGAEGDGVRVVEHLDVVDSAVGRGQLVLHAALLLEQFCFDALRGLGVTSCGVSRPGVRVERPN